MSRRELAFFLLIAGIAVHVFGNAKKAYNSYDSKAGLTAWVTSQSSTDIVYYLATVSLALGAGLLWSAIKPR